MKRWIAVVLLMLAVCMLAGCGSSVSKPEDFVIEDGAVTGYNGKASKIEIPDGVTSIRKEAFKNNTKITSLVIPDSCLSVGYESFFGCKNLQEVVLPDNGIILFSRCFESCYKLKSMNIHESTELRTNSIMHNKNDHWITPCPEAVKITGVINYLAQTTLCNMRVDEGELRLSFVQSAGKLVPISIGLDGSISVDMKAGFGVSLKMKDGSKIGPDRQAVEYNADRNEYKYVFWFPTTERPETIYCRGTKETTELNGTTWRTPEHTFLD